MVGNIRKQPSRASVETSDIDAFRQAALSLNGRTLNQALSIDRVAYTGRFGVELEMVGIDLPRMREVVAAHLGPSARIAPRGVLDSEGRLWEVKPDEGDIVELATPPLEGLQDMRCLAALAQKLERAGATPSTGTGVHVHIDAKGMTERQIVRLLGLVARHETDLMSALGVHAARRDYCRPAPRATLAPLLRRVPTNRPALMRAYRGERTAKFLGTNVEHLAPSQIGTLEFRYFNGTLNPCIIGCHVGLAMALARFAHDASGPMPTIESIQAGGNLATFLRALNLAPEDPSSVYLFRNLMGWPASPCSPAPAPAHPRPGRLDIAALTAMGASRESVMDTLATLPVAERGLLIEDAEKYVKALKLRHLDGYELRALSRLTSSARQRVITEHASAIATLPKAWDRTDAITWFAEHADDQYSIEEAFGDLTLPYRICAPLENTLPLLERINSLGLPLMPDSIDVKAFQALAYMDAPTLGLHMQVWQERIRDTEGPPQWRATLGHIMQCFTGVDAEDARRLLELMRRMNVPFDTRLISPRAFRALASMPDAEEHLELWQQESPMFCPTRWDEMLFLQDMVDKPLELVRAQLHLIHKLPLQPGGYGPLHDRMQGLNRVSASHIGIITAALQHVKPHLANASTLLALVSSFASIPPARLRGFINEPLDLHDVIPEDQGYHIFGLAQNCGDDTSSSSG